ncbi:hypothetical protein C8250_029925 [Streptomyces sp. So13.3]|uniref:hypothetical protein n=1 Tax=Streptomyces TaxID=1883 RepID=UPI001106452A|nr:MULTISPECIES: hypothetical protein [Streptomyces]MCM2425956.1 hypothetical protein [Streptomyces sp. RKAG337]MCZ4098341.1 hypothetical protein [Streptomyces sp. H39-C1]QNA75544.1 hypothetical protein C8250_029925 [Streptomyces sp. So13.3]
MTVSGYRLVVPDEWEKIPVQRGTDKAIAALLDRAFAKHGRDQVAQYRRELEARLKKVINQARQNAGVDLFLPMGNREQNLPASFLISYVEFGRLDAPDPQQVLAEVLSTTRGGEPVEIAGCSGIRTERNYDADPEREVDYASRRIEYILPVPGTADSWLLSSFSTFGGGSPDDDIAKLLGALFDAIMSTFRWKYQQEDA